MQNARDTGFRVDRLRKSTFRQHIAERLRSAILGGEIAPGATLVETTLAAQFNVSRGPLREALRELIEEGLLERWLVAEGEQVHRGKALAEVRIEGATHDILAPAAGRLVRLLESGAMIEPGALIGTLQA